MSLTSYRIQQFGTLNVYDDPQEVGPENAIDLLNIDLDQRGRLRSRDGLAQYDTSGTLPAIPTRVFPDYSQGTPKLLFLSLDATAGNLSLDRISGTGTTFANIGAWDTNTGAGIPSPTGYATLGTPTTTTIFFSTFNTSSPVTLRKYDGAVLAASVGKPAYVGVTPWDNRLVQAWFGAAADSPTGANGSASTVVFSDPGAPETYGANNYLYLNPGDGEDISGIATFNNLLIISKSTNLFIFYGVSTAGTGTPIFNYRRLTMPARISNLNARDDPQWNALITGDDGVYFVTNRGLFRTQGGPPELVSRAVTPIFEQTADDSVAWDGTSTPSLNIAKQRIYFRYTTIASTVRTLVYDIRHDFWTLWEFPAAPGNIVGYATKSGKPESTFFTVNSTHVYKLTKGQTTDYGTDITTRYQSGFYELSPGNKATTRWTKLWGSGSPTFDIYTDHATSDPLTRGGTVTLGTAPVVDSTTHNKSYKGELFSHKLSSTSGAWSVNRIQHDIAETSKP